MQAEDAFVVAIDGPGGSGKGSLSVNVAQALGFHLLDSGAIYRLLALKAMQQGVDLEQESEVIAVLDDFNIRFEAGDELSIPYLDDRDVAFLRTGFLAFLVNSSKDSSSGIALVDRSRLPGSSPSCALPTPTSSAVWARSSP